MVVLPSISVGPDPAMSNATTEKEALSSGKISLPYIVPVGVFKFTASSCKAACKDKANKEKKRKNIRFIIIRN